MDYPPSEWPDSPSGCGQVLFSTEGLGIEDTTLGKRTLKHRRRHRHRHHLPFKIISAFPCQCLKTVQRVSCPETRCTFVLKRPCNCTSQPPRLKRDVLSTALEDLLEVGDDGAKSLGSYKVALQSLGPAFRWWPWKWSMAKRPRGSTQRLCSQVMSKKKVQVQKTLSATKVRPC